jgi:hypothetical protein
MHYLLSASLALLPILLGAPITQAAPTEHAPLSPAELHRLKVAEKIAQEHHAAVKPRAEPERHPDIDVAAHAREYLHHEKIKRAFEVPHVPVTVKRKAESLAKREASPESNVSLQPRKRWGGYGGGCGGCGGNGGW